MQDFIKKARLLGVGLFYLGKEKVEETVAELIRKGELTEKEGRALMIELLAKSKAATKDLEGRIQQMMADAQARLHAPQLRPQVLHHALTGETRGHAIVQRLGVVGDGHGNSRF